MNPIDPDFRLKTNGYMKLGKGEAASDEDVTRLRFLYWDVDAGQKAGLSSSDAEQQDAIDLRDRILTDLDPHGIQDSAIWGKSGNGCWILVRLADHPNDREHQGYTQEAVQRAARLYPIQSGNKAHVDPSTYNPSRMMTFPHMEDKGRPFGRATAPPLDDRRRPGSRTRTGPARHPPDPRMAPGDAEDGRPDARSSGTAGCEAGPEWDQGYRSDRPPGTRRTVAVAAMGSEFDRACSAPEGQRHTLLVKSVFRMGQLIEAGSSPRRRSVRRWRRLVGGSNSPRKRLSRSWRTRSRPDAPSLGRRAEFPDFESDDREDDDRQTIPIRPAQSPTPNSPRWISLRSPNSPTTWWRPRISPPSIVPAISWRSWRSWSTRTR